VQKGKGKGSTRSNNVEALELGTKLMGEPLNFNDERNIKELVEGEESPFKASWKIFTKAKTKGSSSKGRKSRQHVKDKRKQQVQEE